MKIYLQKLNSCNLKWELPEISTKVNPTQQIYMGGCMLGYGYVLLKLYFSI